MDDRFIYVKMLVLDLDDIDIIIVLLVEQGTGYPMLFWSHLGTLSAFAATTPAPSIICNIYHGLMRASGVKLVSSHRCLARLLIC